MTQMATCDKIGQIVKKPKRISSSDMVNYLVAVYALEELGVKNVSIRSILICQKCKEEIKTDESFCVSCGLKEGFLYPYSQKEIFEELSKIRKRFFLFFKRKLKITEIYSEMHGIIAWKYYSVCYIH